MNKNGSQPQNKRFIGGKRFVGGVIFGVALVTVGIALHLNAEASAPLSNIKGSLYVSGYVNEAMLKSKEDQKLLTRRDAAELAVRLYLKVEKKSLENLPSQNNLTDTKDPYAIAAANLKLMGPSKGKFNPGATLNRKDTLAVLTNAIKGITNGTITEGIGTDALNPNGTSAPTGTNGSNGATQTGKALFKEGQKVIGAYEKIGNEKGVKRSDAYVLVQKLTLALKLETAVSINQEEFMKQARTVGGFKAPKPEKSDLLVYESPNGTDAKRQLVLYFSGVNDPSKKMTPKTVHLQAIEVIKSGKTNLTEADYETLLQYLESQYDQVARTYRFSTVQYIYDGQLKNSLPSNTANKHAIKIDQGITLTLTLYTR